MATSDFRKGMQDNINLYVVWNRLNNASFRQKLDPIEKNIFGRLYSTSENKEVLKKYTELWDGFKNEIEIIDGSKKGEYDKDFLKLHLTQIIIYQ